MLTEWILGILGVIVMGLVALTYHNLRETNRNDLEALKEAHLEQINLLRESHREQMKLLREWQTEKFEDVEKCLDKVVVEIGTHTAGLRGRAHRNSNQILVHTAALLQVADKIGAPELKNWLLNIKEQLEAGV